MRHGSSMPRILYRVDQIAAELSQPRQRALLVRLSETLYPTTSATRIAASFRVSLIAPPGRDSQRRATRPVIWSAGFGAFLFWVLGTVSASAQAHPPLPPVRPPELMPPKSSGAPPPAPAVPAPPSSPAGPSVQPQAAAEACLEELKASHVEAEAASSPGALRAS